MNCEPHTKFRSLVHFGESGDTTQLENNLKLWFDWAFLQGGAWIDVNLNDAGAYGGDFSSLRLVADPSYSRGKVWEATRKEWVWEDSVEYTDPQNNVLSPISVSGVYVNGIFTPDGSGITIDYPGGRVIFDTATNGPVKAEYSFRYVQTLIASREPWFKELQTGTFRVDDSGFHIEGSGDWNQLSQSRLQLPAVVIEIIPRRNFMGYELGNNAQWSYQDVALHVLAENTWDRNRISDILTDNKDKTIWLFDVNEVLASGAYPLGVYGQKLNDNTYEYFVSPSGYRWKKCAIVDSHSQVIDSPQPNLYRGVVRWKLETITGG